MNKLTSALCGLAVAALCALPAWAQAAGEPPAAAVEPRELIYCADLMSPAEREAYRTRMHAALAPQEKAAVRKAHRDEMQARARERGMDAMRCEPLRQRQRLRGGTSP